MESNVLGQGTKEAQRPASLSSTVASARKGFAANALSNAAFVGIQAAANLWLTQFLIGSLGLAAFGMVPLASSLIAYTAILTTALNSALSRFLVLDLEGGDAGDANRTFNTSLLALLAIVLAATPFTLAVARAFPTLFDVPSGWEWDASWLFALAVASSFLTVIGSVFSVSPFIFSQFVQINLVNLTGLVVRIGMIAILFVALPPRLWFVGGAMAVGALVMLVGFVLLWRKFTPELGIHVSALDLTRLRSQVSMGGWTTVNTLGGMLLSRADLMVVNAHFGAAVTGGYGSLVQFPLLMESLVGAAASPIRPVILIKYAQQDLAGLERVSHQSVKLLGLLMALPAGLLCGFAAPFLVVWLGDAYEPLAILLVLLICHLGINLSVRPLLFVQTAYNKIRLPGIVTLVTGVIGLGLALVFVRWCNWGVAGVPLAIALAWTTKNAVFVPIYTAQIMRLSWWTFLPSLVPGALGTVAVGLGAYGFTLLRAPDSWLELAASAALVSCAYWAGVWGIGLNRTDRQLVRELLPHQPSHRPTVMKG